MVVCFQRISVKPICVFTSPFPSRLVAGGAVSKVDPDSTGLNPAWRKALAQIGYNTGWAEGASTTEITQLRKQLAQNLKKISDLTPGSGAYFNEVSVLARRPIDPMLRLFSRHQCLSLTPATHSLVRIMKI